MKLLFDPKLVNKITGAKTGSLVYRWQPSSTAKVMVSMTKGNSAGRTSGNYVIQADGKWYQVVLNPPSNQIAWIPEVDTNLWDATKNLISDEEAKKLIDKLIASDSEIFHSLLRSGAVLIKAKESGKNVSSLEAKLKQLTERLQQRQEKIKTSKILQWQAGLKKGYDKAIAWFKNLFIGSGLGAVPIVAVVVSAVVGAGLATAAYFAFKPEYSESQEDLKISADLEKALASLDPATSEAVKQDLEGQIDKAYNRGLTDGSFGGIFNTLKYVAVFVVGYLIIDTVYKKKK